MAENKKAKEVKNSKNEAKKVESTTNPLYNRSLLIAIGIVIIFILAVILITNWRNKEQEELYSTSYLITSGTVSLEIKNLEEVSQILSEAPSEYFILITYTGNSDTYDLETGIKTIIDDYNLSDAFYYLNIESIMEEDNYLTRLNSTFNTDLITTVPIILYYKNGELVDVVLRDDDNIINAADFQKLIDIYYE